MLLMPTIIEKTGRTDKVIDIPSKLFQDGVVTLFGPVMDESAYLVVTQLLYLDSLKTDDPVNLYINSPGGSIYAGLAIHDVIRKMRRKVNTTVIGMAASMGAFLLFSGTGTRAALPNSRIMIHSASSGFGEQTVVHDMKIDYEETKYLNDKLIRLISQYSGDTILVDKVEELTQRDKYLTPLETKQMGLIDEIL